jgi:oxygen-independent coproporphyrinogen-3 oxidase
VPFCEVKCAYCHFAIDPRRPGADREGRYLEALLAEMEAAATPPAAADTLYLGGGTPTVMSTASLARILDTARRRYGLPDHAEATVEANPADLAADGYRALRDAGFDRLSLGAQSFDEGVLREMGRPHGAAAIPRAAGAAREGGFDNLSLDLILGWPGETPARWRRTLDAAKALAPEHVSLYVLEVEGRTALSHRASRGLVTLPEDDLVADLYRETVDALGAAGIERYEISNFARPGRESRHNRKYWSDAPFLGFGMSAHSYRQGRRTWNVDTFGAYCAAIEKGGGRAARAGERILTGREHRAEALFTGLRRREGVDRGDFRRRYGVDPLDEHGPALADAFAAGLLVADERALRLTERGVLLSNEVFQALI